MGRNQHQHSPLGVSFDEALGAIAAAGKPDSRQVAAKPFVKWVGGKRSIIPALLERMPQQYDTYRELFLGGGALYFAVQPQKAVLSDINFHLIVTYNAIKNDVDSVIACLRVCVEQHSIEFFAQARDRLTTESDPAQIAALFIYLNKTCFNGLYRVNASGKFNVPIGKYSNPAILDEENLRNVSALLQSATIENNSFTEAEIVEGDFYYLDPPYHETYDGYHGSRFADDTHEKLAAFCKLADKTGAFFMLSNSDTEFVRKLYKGYNIEVVSASRNVSCKANQRGKEEELIIRNY